MRRGFAKAGSVPVVEITDEITGPGHRAIPPLTLSPQICLSNRDLEYQHEISSQIISI
jgi:hypothetical protein